MSTGLPALRIKSHAEVRSVKDAELGMVFTEDFCVPPHRILANDETLGRDGLVSRVEKLDVVNLDLVATAELGGGRRGAGRSPNMRIALDLTHKSPRGRW